MKKSIQELTRLLESHLPPHMASQLQQAMLCALHECDEENREMSWQIYETVTQSLYSLLICIELIERQFPDALDSSVRLYFEQVKGGAVDSMDKISGFAVWLNPSYMKELGLVSAIKSYMSRTGKKRGIRTRLHAGSDFGTYSLFMQSTIFRLVCSLMDTVFAEKPESAFLKLAERAADDGGRELQIEAHWHFDTPQSVPAATNLLPFGESHLYMIGGKILQYEREPLARLVDIRLPVRCKG